jgi:membrane protease YdiL (CAAX protease family)
MMESSAPPQRPDGYLPDAPWRYRDFFFAFLAGLVSSLVVSVAVAAVGADPLAPTPFALVYLGQFAGTFGAIVWLSRARGTGSLATDVGLVLKPGDWWGVPAGMGLQILIALITAPLIFRLFPEGPPEQAVAEIATTSQTLLDQILVIVAVAIGAPILEEMLFRGMLLSTLRRHLPAWGAVVISAIVFAGVHLVDPNAAAAVPGLFLLGLVLGWVALRRGDLSLAIPLHSGINLLAAISLLWGDELLQWSEDQLRQIEGIVHLLPF